GPARRARAGDGRGDRRVPTGHAALRPARGARGRGAPARPGPRAGGAARPRPPGRRARGRGAVRGGRGPRRGRHRDLGGTSHLAQLLGFRRYPGRVTRRLILLTVLAFAALAAPASAGQYAVYACGSYGNHSWSAVGAGGIAA